MRLTGFMKRIIGCLLCIVMTAGLTCACGKAKYEDSIYTGSWIAATISTGDMDLMPSEIGGDLRIDLLPEGTGTIAYKGEEEGFSWEETGEGAVLTYEDGTTGLITASGDRLMISEGDVTFILQKAEAPSAGEAATEGGSESAQSSS